MRTSATQVTFPLWQTARAKIRDPKPVSLHKYQTYEKEHSSADRHHTSLPDSVTKRFPRSSRTFADSEVTPATPRSKETRLPEGIDAAQRGEDPCVRKPRPPVVTRGPIDALRNVCQIPLVHS